MNKEGKQPTIYESVREIEHALNYAARYFGSHAVQRLKTLRYFLAYTLVLSAGLYKVLIDCHYGILFIGSLLSLGITIFFFALEKRNRQLVNFASEACKELEEELIFKLPKKRNGNSFEHINVVQKGEENRGFFSYRRAADVFFSVLLSIQFIFAILACFSWLNHEFGIQVLPFDVFEAIKEECVETR